MVVNQQQIPAGVKALCAKLRETGHGAWLVGGGLRDVLLGREPKDWDIATSATPQVVMSTFRRVVPTGLEHGTVTVLHHGVGYEVTTLRGEGAYSDSRRPDSVHFVDSIERDLARRDFTINAIAYDLATSKLIDPFRGLDDLGKRCIRTVGSAAERFAEDGLRVLRAARFVATLDFELEAQTEAAIPGALDAFSKVSAERVRDEWLKALRSSQAARAFAVMERTGILAITCPHLAKQVGCTQNRHHAYDVWTHTLRCLDACEGDPVLKLSALLHDIGKPQTRADSKNAGESTFYNHEVVGAKLADEWMRSFRFSNDERARVTHLVRHHIIMYAPSWTDAAVRRFVKRVGPPCLSDLFALARADLHGKGRGVSATLAELGALEARVAAQTSSGAVLQTKNLALSGQDLIIELGLKPSRLIGDILEQLLESVLDAPENNTREQLLVLAKSIVNEKHGIQ